MLFWNWEWSEFWSIFVKKFWLVIDKQFENIKLGVLENFEMSF